MVTGGWDSSVATNSRCVGEHDVVTPVTVLEKWSALRLLHSIVTVCTRLGPLVTNNTATVVDVGCWIIGLEPLCWRLRHVTLCVKTGEDIHLNPNVWCVTSAVVDNVDILTDCDGLAPFWRCDVHDVLSFTVTSTGVEGYSQHVIVGVRSLVTTSTDVDLNRYVGTCENVVDALEVESDDVIEVVVCDEFSNVLNTDTNLLRCNTLLVVRNRHDGWVVVWHVVRCCSSILQDETDVTEVTCARWDLMDTVVVQVVDFPSVCVGCCIWNKCEHKIVSNNFSAEVVLVCTLVG